MPYEGNPRQMTEKQRADLEESMKRFNLVEIPAIDKNGTVIAGHQRLRVLRALGRGEEEIDVRLPNRKLTRLEFEEYNIRSNLNTGEWNYDMLANFDEALLADAGFESDELDKIFNLKEKQKDEAPPLPDVPQSKPGDLYLLGEHRVLCGDCCQADDMNALMGKQKASMVFTDPPYNVDYQGPMHGPGHNKTQTKRRAINNDKMATAEFYKFLDAFLKQAIAHCKGAFYICMGSKELHTLRQAWEANGGHWQNYIVWVKNQFTLSRSDYQHQYEPILYGWITDHHFTKNRDKANVWEDLREVQTKYDGEYTSIKFAGYEVRIKGKAEGHICKKKQMTDIWRYNKPSVSEEHPTMKPVDMVEHAVRNSSKRGQIVLDCFLGSGSTLIAAQESGRICYGIDNDPAYVDVAVKRFEELYGQKAEKKRA